MHIVRLAGGFAGECDGRGGGRAGGTAVHRIRRARDGGSWAAIALSLATGATALALPAIAPARADTSGDGVAAAIESQVMMPDADNRLAPPGSHDDEREASASPHWCNETGSLVDDIHRHGGESVMRMEVGRGRVLERYWNETEEVIIEHGPDGNSCLLELRRRRSAGG